MAVSGLIHELRHQIRVASRRDLLISAIAMIGLGAILIAGGWWFVTAGTLAVEYIIEKPSRLTTRTGNNVGGMALYWGLIGWAMVLPGAVLAVCGMIFGISACRRRTINHEP